MPSVSSQSHHRRRFHVFVGIFNLEEIIIYNIFINLSSIYILTIFNHICTVIFTRTLNVVFHSHKTHKFVRKLTRTTIFENTMHYFGDLIMCSTKYGGYMLWRISREAQTKGSSLPPLATSLHYYFHTCHFRPGIFNDVLH